MHEFGDAHAVRVVNPEVAQAWCEVVHEIRKRAHPLWEASLGIGWQAADHPVGLATRVEADIGESNQFELRRSSGAEVSQGIAAIDDYQSRAVESGRGVAQEMSQRNVNGAADVRGVEFMRRQDVDYLRTTGRKHRGQLAMLNFAHGYARIAARAERAVSTIVSPLPAAIRAVSIS